jgi:hypothetical protein
LRVEVGGVVGGGVADDPAVDEELDQRVAAEPVGTVQPASGLADRVQAGDPGAVILGARPDAAHRVVGGGCDLDRRGRDVEHLQLDQRLVDAGEPLHDCFSGQVGDVEAAGWPFFGGERSAVMSWAISWAPTLGCWCGRAAQGG